VPIRLVLADDHPVVLQGLERLFGESGGFRVLQSCRDGEDALAAVRAHRPDILVLDLRMPKRSGIDVLRAMTQEQLPCRVVVLTAALDDEDLVELLRLGVMGLVRKEASPDVLVDCVRRVHQGQKAIDRDMAAVASARVLRRESAVREIAATLTPREIEIVRQVGEGLRNREIADRLSISEGTVKIHLHNIYEKIGVDTRVGLVLYAQEKGLL
jgi:DNA-binding NarL/FixJ family response regulator